MPLRCESKAALLQPPEGGLTFQEQLAISTSPFTLSGAPMNNRPESMKGLSELRRKPTATTNFALSDIYFDRRNYYEIYVDSSNILEGNSNTTLRYEGLSYTLLFGALHKGIWDSKTPQFSLFFTNSASHFFHICIPIEYTNTTENQNPFLAAWLTNTAPPSGFTMNDIFSMPSDIELAVLPFCLEYNKGHNNATYTMVMLKTPARIAQANLPAWLKSDPTMTKTVPIPGENDTAQRYKRTTFDQILNYMMRGSIRKWIADKPDPYVVSDDVYFDGSQQQNVVKPTYVKLPSIDLSNRRITPVNTTEGFQTSKTIKCYPLDLQTDVRDNKVILDERTKQAIPYDEYKQSSLITQMTNASSVEFINSFRYYFVVTIILLLGITLIFAGIFFVFRSRSTVDLNTIANTVPTSLLENIKKILGDGAKNAATKASDIGKLVNPTTP